MTYSISLFSKVFLSLGLALIVLLFPNGALATDSFGWFASKVEYVDSNLPAGCDPATRAAIEIWLVEKGTKNQLANSIGTWNVNIRNSINNDNVAFQSIQTGSKTSNRICFDPTVNGIQVVVDSSTNYKPITTPSIFPNSVDGTLSSLYGNTFRGYVEVDTISSSAPSASSISPAGGVFGDTPSFIIHTNPPASSFNASAVATTKIYVSNYTTNQNYSYLNDAPASFNANNSFIGPDGLTEGTHYWTFHQDLNGYSEAYKYSAPAKMWTFSRTPASGVPHPMSFLVDKTPPTVTLSDFKVTQVSSDGLSATVAFTRTLFDANAGLDQAQLFIVKGGVTTTFAPITFSGPVQNSRTDTVTLNGIERDVDYQFYYVTRDRVGNFATSTPVTYIASSALEKPAVAFPSSVSSGYDMLTHSSFRGHGIVTNADVNPVPTTAVSVCWSIDPADLEEVEGAPYLAPGATSASTKNSPGKTCQITGGGYNPGSSHWWLYPTDLPSNATIYFRSSAVNTIGWGHSPIGSFSTAISPYEDTLGTTTIPTVLYQNPQEISEMTRLNPGIRITSAGNQPISQYGICYDTDSSSIADFNPSYLEDAAYLSAWNSRCKLFGPLATSTPLPYSVKNTFTGLVPNTTYHFKAFAINDTGVGSSIGYYATKPYVFDFRNQTLRLDWYEQEDSYPRFSTSSLIYREATHTYDNLGVLLSFYDWSSESLPNNAHRTIDYELRLHTDNIPIPAYRTWGTATAVRRNGSNQPQIQTVYLNNIPIGVPITVYSEVNRREDGTETYPNVSPTHEARTRSATITLESPNSINSPFGGSDESSGSDLNINPEFEFQAIPQITRAGRTTKINWSMLNLDIGCVINGPQGWSIDSFNPSIDGDIDPVTNRSGGTVITPTLHNTQLFELSCTNIYGTTYSTTTRVSIIGNVQEL